MNIHGLRWFWKAKCSEELATLTCGTEVNSGIAIALLELGHVLRRYLLSFRMCTHIDCNVLSILVSLCPACSQMQKNHLEQGLQWGFPLFAYSYVSYVVLWLQGICTVWKMKLGLREFVCLVLELLCVAELVVVTGESGTTLHFSTCYQFLQELWENKGLFISQLWLHYKCSIRIVLISLCLILLKKTLCYTIPTIFCVLIKHTFAYEPFVFLIKDLK